MVCDQCAHNGVAPGEHFGQEYGSGKAVTGKAILPVAWQAWMPVTWRTPAGQRRRNGAFVIHPFKIKQLDLVEAGREKNIAARDICMREVMRFQVAQDASGLEREGASVCGAVGCRCGLVLHEPRPASRGHPGHEDGILEVGKYADCVRAVCVVRQMRLQRSRPG